MINWSLYWHILWEEKGILQEYKVGVSHFYTHMIKMEGVFQGGVSQM